MEQIHQNGSLQPTDTYLILSSNLTFDCISNNHNDVFCYGTASPEHATLVTATTPGASPPLPPLPRPRLATWAFSPDSGYSDYNPSPVAVDYHIPVPTNLKRRANSTEDLTFGDIQNGKVSCNFVEDIDAEETGQQAEGEQGFSKIDITFPKPAKGWRQFPCRIGGTEICILRQPESQHRPRYETEGSRGRIKDRTGSSSPAVQLKGFTGRSAILHVFIGEEKDPVGPHALYRVCKVNNKYAAPAIIRRLEDGTTVLEMAFTAKEDWTIAVDCVSIMKLRNADFEDSTQDPEDLKKTKRKSTGSRKIRKETHQVLQLEKQKNLIHNLLAAMGISYKGATPGLPEISFVSHDSCPVSGGTDVVIIGRNFVKNDSKLLVFEKNSNDEVIWQREAAMRMDKFNQVHLVAGIPAYDNLVVKEPVEVFLIVKNTDGKQSDPQKFYYTPNPLLLEDPRSRSARHSPSPLLIPSAPSPLREPPAATQLVNALMAPSSVSSHDSNLTDSVTTSTPSPDTSIPSSSSQPLFAANSSAVPNCIHYCIQIPGYHQPLIITVPQFNSAQPTTTVSCAQEIDGSEQEFVQTTRDDFGQSNSETGRLENDMDYGQYCPLKPSEEDQQMRDVSSEIPKDSDGPTVCPTDDVYDSEKPCTEQDRLIFEELLREILEAENDPSLSTEAVGFGLDMSLLPNVAPGTWFNENDNMQE